MPRAPNCNTRWWSELSSWDGKVQRVEVIDEDLGKSGANAFARGGFQYLLAEMSLARAGLVLSFDASRLARNNRDWYQLRTASAPSSADFTPTVNGSTIRDSTTTDYCWG
jgi:Resolvase, N terminal domain